MSDIIYSNKIPMNAIIKIIARGEAESNYFIKATGGEGSGGSKILISLF